MPLRIAFLVAGFVAIAATGAQAADTWEEAGAGAVAILPDPRDVEGLTAGTLYCIEQRWAFQFRIDPSRTAALSGPGMITIGWTEYPVAGEIKSGSLDVTIPVDMLEPLKSANGMKVVFGTGADRLGASFNMRASRRVIDAIAPRCSQIDMAGYVPVTLSDMGAATLEAEPLLKDELRMFREFTGLRPVLAATTMELEGGNRLLFATICGSTSYYGPSGCNLSGFARTPSDDAWREVYNTEGMHLYTDPAASNGGYPNLVTLEMVGGQTPIHWLWTGETYALLEQVIAEDAEGEQPEEGDAAE